MGISLLSLGHDAQWAYDVAVFEAEQVYGHQHGYSGAINSTNGFKEIRLEQVDPNLPLERDAGWERAPHNLGVVYGGTMKQLYAMGLEERVLNKMSESSYVACVNLGLHEYRGFSFDFQGRKEELLSGRGSYEISRTRDDKYVAHVGAEENLDKWLHNYFRFNQLETLTITRPRVNGSVSVIPNVAVTTLDRSVMEARQDLLWRGQNVYWFCGWASC